MSNRNRPGIPPSQQSHGPRRVHGVGPWQAKARDAVEMIVALERHTHPEMDKDAIAGRVIAHAKEAPGLDPDERFQTTADIDREADTNPNGVLLAGGRASSASSSTTRASARATRSRPRASSRLSSTR